MSFERRDPEGARERAARPQGTGRPPTILVGQLLGMGVVVTVIGWIALGWSAPTRSDGRC